MATGTLHFLRKTRHCPEIDVIKCFCFTFPPPWELPSQSLSLVLVVFYSPPPCVFCNYYCLFSKFLIGYYDCSEFFATSKVSVWYQIYRFVFVFLCLIPY